MPGRNPFSQAGLDQWGDAMAMTGANMSIGNIREDHRLRAKRRALHDQREQHRAMLEAKRVTFDMDKSLETYSIESSLNSLISAAYTSNTTIATRETAYNVKLISIPRKHDLEYIIAEHLDYGYTMQGNIIEANEEYSVTLIKKNSKRL